MMPEVAVLEEGAKSSASSPPLAEAAPQAPAPDASLENVARGMSWTVLGRSVGQVLWYGSLLLLAVLVPPSAFGAVAVGSVIVAITTLLMESGTGGTIVIATEISAAYLRRAVLRTGLAGLAMCCVAAALAGPIMRLFARGGDPDVLRAMLIAVALAAFSIVPLALLKRTLHFRRQTLVLIGAAIVAALVAIATAAAGAGVWALVTRIVVYQAFVTLFAWIAVLDLLPRRSVTSRASTRPPAAARWFMIIALAAFAAQTFDNLIVGHFTNVRALGLYAMAFALGLAPTTQISWQVGGVLFPAIAATRDPQQVAARTLKAMRLMTLLLLPLLPVAVLLAPVLVPKILGAKWEGMVTPFQVLIAVGIIQGIVNIMAESLAASGAVRTRAWIDTGWALLTMGAIAVGAVVGGINGAAYGHLAIIVVLIGGYLRWGAPRIALSPGAVARDLAGPIVAVCVQAVVTALMWMAVRDLGLAPIPSALTAVALGVAALVMVLPKVAPALTGEVREVFRAAAGRRQR